MTVKFLDPLHTVQQLEEILALKLIILPHGHPYITTEVGETEKWRKKTLNYSLLSIDVA